MTYRLIFIFILLFPLGCRETVTSNEWKIPKNSIVVTLDSVDDGIIGDSTCDLTYGIDVFYVLRGKVKATKDARFQRNHAISIGTDGFVRLIGGGSAEEAKGLDIIVVFEGNKDLEIGKLELIGKDVRIR